MTLRTVCIIAVVAFIAGYSPTIYNYVTENIVYTLGEGLSLHPRLLNAVSSFLALIHKYAWHIVAVYALIIAFVIFMENQNPDRTILWLITLVLLPGVGLIIYMIIGPDFHHLKDRKRFKPPKVQNLVHGDYSQDKRYLLGRLLHACSGAELMMHNKVEILIDGDEKFSALKQDLKQAKCYIHMQYFILKDDEIGTEIADLLVDAAHRGVKVRVLYDAVGSWKLGRKYIKRLTDAGVMCRSFMPMAFPRLRRKMNFRNHRKIVVIDDKISYTGGLNVGDEYLGKGPLGNWRDTHVRIFGEASGALHKIFLQDWCIRSGEDPAFISEELASQLFDAEDLSFPHLPVVPIQVVPSGIDSTWHSIQQGFLSMIARAKNRVWITTPYLVPGPPIMNALANTALSGVDVRVLIPAAKDHFLVHWASRGNVEPLIRAGVRVYFYEKGFIHSKTVLSDEDICSVGTCNFDVRSLEINFENQLFIYDKNLNHAFAEQFLKDLDDASEVILSEWENRPLWQKILESFGRLYSAQI